MKSPFLHGWQSVPGGVKPTYEAVRIAQAEFDKHQSDVIVGSSSGRCRGNQNELRWGETRFALPGVEEVGDDQEAEAPSTVILHSQADDVVPFTHNEELTMACGATLIQASTDHGLADPEPLAKMLEACDGRAE